jgi:hypothetical protein
MSILDCFPRPLRLGDFAREILFILCCGAEMRPSLRRRKFPEVKLRLQKDMLAHIPLNQPDIP